MHYRPGAETMHIRPFGNLLGFRIFTSTAQARGVFSPTSLVKDKSPTLSPTSSRSRRDQWSHSTGRHQTQSSKSCSDDLLIPFVASIRPISLSESPGPRLAADADSNLRSGVNHPLSIWLSRRGSLPHCAASPTLWPSMSPTLCSLSESTPPEARR